ncbi:O-antigen ligase family protein [Sphingobium aromaticiconvertens]|uniref:O-antigen ligase family protein n=1 Tax=Sphingobium aromaticiconvertens TaxID=365341 RepID=UPI0030170655
MRFAFLILLFLLCGGLVLEAYLAIKPAMHVVVISVTAVALFLFCVTPQHRRDMAWRTFVITMAMPILAWSLGNIWLLFALLGIGVPLIARRFAMIVPVYLFSLLLLPGLDIPVMIGPLKLFDFSVLDALAFGASATIFLDKRKAQPHIHHDIAAGAVIFLVGAALARDTSFSHLLRSSLNVVIDLGLPYYIVSRGVRTLEEVRVAMLWIGCGGVTLASLLFYEFLKGWPIYNILYANFHLPTLLIVKERAGYLRAAGPFTEPTSVAMVLAICMLCLWLCRAFFRSSWHHLLLLAVTMAGLFAPQSRGAWIGLILGMMLSELFRRRYLSIITKGGTVAIGLAMLLLAATISPNVSESIGLSGDSSDSSDYRRRLFDRGLEVFLDRPMLGYSVPELHIRLADLRQGEGIIDFVNSYLWILLMSGIGGLVIFVAPFLFYTWSVWRARPAVLGAYERREAATFIFASLGMTLEMLFFNSFGTRPAVFVFILFGLAAAFLGSVKTDALSHRAVMATV